MKFSIHSRAVLGALGLFALGPDAGAASVIANGSFELPAFTFAANVYVIRNTTNPTGWSRTGTSIAWYTDHLGFNPSDGMQFLEFEGFTAQLYQSFPTTPGAEYTVSFDYAPSGNTSGVDDAVSARIDGVERLYIDGTTTVKTPLTWTNQSFTFVATSSSTELRFVDGGPVAGLDGGFLDNVKVGPTVDPVALTLSVATVAGCKKVTGTATLPGPAPTDKVVTLADTLDAATTPASVTIPAGATTKSFSIGTAAVASNQAGTVSATLDGATASQPLTIRPMGMQAITFKPTSAVGGALPAVVGTAKLECKAGPGPVTVDLASSKPEVAYPVAASIVVPVGLQSAPFDVMTEQVYAKTPAPISATANGIRKTKSLTVYPWASVSPTSLRFGGVTVATVSGTLSATLSNKGVGAVSVDGIRLTGTGAAWYAQTNDCPASLAPGASCSIAVTFTPVAALSKSAKLTIANSATGTPLSVSLSGTGLTPL